MGSFAVVINKESLNDFLRQEALSAHYKNLEQKTLPEFEIRDKESNAKHHHLPEGLSAVDQKKLELIKHDIDESRKDKQSLPNTIKRKEHKHGGRL